MKDGNGNRSKHYINGVSLFRYCEEKGLGKTEYARCLWLIHNKSMTAEEALNYHRPPARQDKDFIRKVNQRRRYAIDKKYLYYPDKFLIKMGYQKQSKYFYKGKRISEVCKKKDINSSTVYNRILKYGLQVKDAITMTREELNKYIKKAMQETGDRKNTGKIIKNERWAKRKNNGIHNGGKNKKKVINIETLEVYCSLTDLAQKLNISSTSVYNGILLGGKIKGGRYEYFDEWVLWENKEKEKHTIKNNIYFM